MKPFPLLMSALLTGAAIGQTAGDRGVRLVYELPVDALQRTLQDRPEQDLEQLLVDTIAKVQLRVPGGVAVTRAGATGFTVEVPSGPPEDLDLVRASIETPGKFEMRIVAHDRDLTSARERLQRWLDGGGYARLRRDPRAIADLPAGEPEVRWFARRIRESTRNPGRWDMRMQDTGLGAICVAGHTAADWNDGVMPAPFRALPSERQFLVELVAVDMAEPCFQNRDLDPAGIAVVGNLQVGTAVRYRIVAARAREYADWTEKHLRQCCAMLLDDEVLSLPRFVARIAGGHGQVSAVSARQAEIMAAAMRAPLLARPELIRTEAR